MISKCRSAAKPFTQGLIWLLFSLGCLTSNRVNGQSAATILFVSDRDGQRALYTMQVDGSHVERFIDNSFEEGGALQEASLSPDGTTLAFISRKNRGNHPTDALFQLDIASGQITPLSDDNSNDSDFPVWSPDGSHLAYLADGLYGNYGQVYIWDALSKEKHILTTGSLLGDTVNDVVGGITGLDWSPDGERLVLAVQTSLPTGNNMLVVINADGTNPQQITAEDVGAALPAWRWQPDTIYFVCTLEGYSEICNLDLQTLGYDLITINLHEAVPGDHIDHLKWLNVSSDGQFLLQFVSNEDIYLYKTEDGSVTNLTAASGGINTSPYWASISTPTVAGTSTFTLNHIATPILHANSELLTKRKP